MKKKIVVLSLCVAMLAVAIIGGTMAYFTDTEQATNTMVIGNVRINIEEYQKNEAGEYEPFVDEDFVLYPIESDQGFEFRNKVVYTVNTSPSEDDAYIRTIVLIEANDLLSTEYANEAGCCVPGLHWGFFNGETQESNIINGKMIHGSTSVLLDGTVTIGEEEYWVVVFEEVNGEAIPYDEALYSLREVWMDKGITSEQIAGWGEDGNVDIIVFSQGIQAAGLTHAEAMEALGEVTETNLQSWIGVDDADINDWWN